MLLLSVALAQSLRADYGDIALAGQKPYPFVALATDGSQVSLEALRGKVVLVYLFTTQPGAGMMELRMIQKYVWPIHGKKGLVIIGIGRQADMPELKKISEDMHLSFPLVPDPQKEIFLHYASKGHPRAYIIGKDGTIKMTSLGYTDDEVDRISEGVAVELIK
jgi:peroxiredoxin